jgi:hypothetical protein
MDVYYSARSNVNMSQLAAGESHFELT